MRAVARRFASKSTGRRGWSLIELTIILICLSVLCAILAPVIGRYVRNAKMIRCREDVQALGCAIWMFVEDTGNSCFLRDGSLDGPGATPANTVELVVTDGDIPGIGPHGADEWARPVNLNGIDFLAYHLITNNPGNDPVNAYPTPRDLQAASLGDPVFAKPGSGGFNSEFAWRGPYMTAPLDPDPWGNRYAVNCVFMGPNPDPEVNGYTEDTIVLSAGPDEEVDTQWAVDGLTPGDDDVIYMVCGNSGS